MPSLYSVLSPLLCILTVVSILSTTGLYIYPLLLNCSYPNPNAPFRLLTLADPQLEGNTSIYSSRYASSPPWIRSLRRFRKTLDLWGNDHYLAHIYRTLHTTVPALTRLLPFLPQGMPSPTHVTVLGDLIGSQWISNTEFNSRGNRFWNTVFPTARRLPPRALTESGRIPKTIYPLIQWPYTLINVVGNHDIGYSGDIRPDLIQRFEETYGPVNYEFTIPFPEINVSKSVDGGPPQNVTINPTLRVINLNSLNIDSPARDYDIQMQTYNFMNKVFSEDINWDGSVATVLLTHVPLHKPAGVCVDPPMEKYYEPKYGSLLREQNHISKGATDMLLGELFGIRRAGEENIGEGKEMGIILTGHDHEGCDTVHWFGKNDEEQKKEGEEKTWKSAKWGDRDGRVGQGEKWVREVTVRSMMGEFGGNAGLTSAWFDEKTMSWRFEYSSCPVGVQHFWWTVHIVDFITMVLAIVVGIMAAVGADGRKKVPKVVVTKANGSSKGIKEKKVQ
ncbi:hypothetical protein TWF225_010775 [Orbilia oligospora]|nr:hypothetical protein TWF225_010775 [Orbilia oligospora]KAF3235352.1 hypothetical protein TWF128_001872 [Orbilia oligospora]KAF3235353.1 hypothetical protein TWF128_001872 [Orbilia oligospora]KAF3243975.1 hypothetical protein TWF217_011084 [Orbilia oligospora]